MSDPMLADQSDRPSAFRRAIVPISLALASVTFMGALIWMAFGGQRDDVAVSRAFLTHIAAEEHSEAVALLHPSLSAQVGPGGLARIFGEIEPWDHIGFSSRSSHGRGDGRFTELYGVGEAVSGCESALRVELLGGLIQSFDITPLCPRAGTDI
ncbi:hypothetical protein [Gymnodinialimonas ceratoperidinii]|uniref:Uncharacterized protein n=1 Tax=Gymnodinialimonas ceratoperidinii TaxID=2856823 RepID=A0A8F6TWR7_9RHOB|nr:hypothetical protein [Gymnodinialimonas ceratoperidinii]QXT39344.1 hypothetical protein KYE46_15670 [Gymnodinialimonas ceratoperidinii]